MIKQFLKDHTSIGLRSSIRSVWREIGIFRKHRKGIHLARRFAGLQNLKLHVGCGTRIKEGWVNIDLSSSADIVLDLRESLPFAENSCAIIYSEHFLEHIDYPEPAGSFLKECYRILQTGGLFSVGVPDTEWLIAEYSGLRAEGYFQAAKHRWHPPWCQTEMEHINYHFRQGGEHRFAYDFKTLAHALAGAGFERIRHREFEQELDSADWKLGTLYADAFKPQTKAEGL